MKKSNQAKGAKTTRRGAQRVKLNAIKASYVCRFNGFFRYPPVGQSTPHHLVGVGRFDIDNAGSLIGEQRASFIPLFSSGLKFQHSRYQLKGKYSLNGDGTGEVTIDFYNIDQATGQPASRPEMYGEFAVCYTGPAVRPKTLWLVSSRTEKKGITVDEMVSGEATLVD